MCIESQHSTPSAETFSKTLGSASDKIDINHSLNLLIKNIRVGHVIVTVLGNRCLDIKINPQLFFLPDGISNSSLSSFPSMRTLCVCQSQRRS